MTDAGAIVAAVQSLKAAGDILKALRSADLAFEKAELKLKFAGLAEQIVNARTAVMNAQQQIMDLQEEVRRLSAAKDVSTELTFKSNVYFRVDAQGKESGPFCPRCHDSEHKLVHLAELPPAFRELARYTCANCRGTF